MKTNTSYILQHPQSSKLLLLPSSKLSFALSSNLSQIWSQKLAISSLLQAEAKYARMRKREWEEAFQPHPLFPLTHP